MTKHVIPVLSATAFSIFGLMGVASAHTLSLDEPEFIPDTVTITDVRGGGSGCPDGTVTAIMSPDYQALTIMFDDYVAQIGPGIDPGRKRLFCQIALNLNFPAGYSYSLVDLTYRGYASLDPGVTAQQKSTYFFQGVNRDDRYSFNTKILGVFDDNYVRTDELTMFSWSPCDKQRALNIVTSVQLDNRYNKLGNGMITVDSVDTAVTEIYGLRWRKCT